MFLTSFTDAVLHLLGTAFGQTVGSAVYDLLKEMFRYFYKDAENGYFVDHPEDTDRENTPENIAKRIKVVLGEKNNEGQFTEAAAS